MSMYFKLFLVVIFGLAIGAFGGSNVVNVVGGGAGIVAFLCVALLLWPREEMSDGGSIIPLIYAVILCAAVYGTSFLAAPIDWPWDAIQINGQTILR